MQSSNSSARAASEADARRRRGPADRRQSVHPGRGGGGKTAPPKMCEFFLKINLMKTIFFFVGHFFSTFFLGSWKYFGVWYAALFWCAVGSVLRGFSAAFSRSKAFCKAAHLLN